MLTELFILLLVGCYYLLLFLAGYLFREEEVERSKKNKKSVINNPYIACYVIYIVEGITNIYICLFKILLLFLESLNFSYFCPF
jgi:hypothetical protein